MEAPDTASFDVVRHCIVILMGSLAKHLDKDDPKVKPIVAKLINTLSTPSQQVGAVGDCMSSAIGSSEFLCGFGANREHSVCVRPHSW